MIHALLGIRAGASERVDGRIKSGKTIVGCVNIDTSAKD